MHRVFARIARCSSSRVPTPLPWYSSRTRKATFARPGRGSPAPPKWVGLCFQELLPKVVDIMRR
jgi:hypothetical protein